MTKKILVLCVKLVEFVAVMKKLFSIVALLAFVGGILLTGCKKADETPPPAPPTTNAPAPAQ